MSWLKDIPEAHRDKVKLLILENRDLRERLRLERIGKYGPAAERLSDAQLELLELEPGVNAAEVEAEAQRAQLQLALKAKSGDRKRPTGRQPLPPELPRVYKMEHFVDTSKSPPRRRVTPTILAIDALHAI